MEPIPTIDSYNNQVLPNQAIQHTNHFTKIPKDILKTILFDFALQDLRSCRRVCHWFREKIDADLLVAKMAEQSTLKIIRMLFQHTAKKPTLTPFFIGLNWIEAFLGTKNKKNQSELFNLCRTPQQFRDVLQALPHDLTHLRLNINQASQAEKGHKSRLQKIFINEKSNALESLVTRIKELKLLQRFDLIGATEDFNKDKLDQLMSSFKDLKQLILAVNHISLSAYNPLISTFKLIHQNLTSLSIALPSITFATDPILPLFTLLSKLEKLHITADFECRINLMVKQGKSGDTFRGFYKGKFKSLKSLVISNCRLSNKIFLKTNNLFWEILSGMKQLELFSLQHCFTSDEQNGGEDWQPNPFFHARFNGSCQDGTLQLKAEKLDIKLPLESKKRPRE